MNHFTFRKALIYILGLTLLGVTVTFIQQTNLGMSSWDALNRNFYEGIPLDYKYLTPAVAVVIIAVAYLIQRKKPDLLMLFPILISFYIGFVIDFLLLYVPSVVEMGLILNLLYLFLAIVVCATGLNLLVYTGYPLPALDEFCNALAKVLHISFGKAKFLGEVIALFLTIIAGLGFGHWEEWFYIGPTTLIFTLAIGVFVDILKKPIRFILEGRDANRDLQG